MVMKDKLVKTNHTATYYIMRKMSLVILAIIGAAFVIAVPTYIIQNSQKNTIGLAEENTSEVSESESSEEGEETYESFND